MVSLFSMHIIRSVVINDSYFLRKMKLNLLTEAIHTTLLTNEQYRRAFFTKNFKENMLDITQLILHYFH